MLKLGVIGLGDIAQKAYLPIYSSMEGIEFHLFTPNQDKCAAIGAKYRFQHLHTDLSSLIKSGVKGAFVHSSTETHEDIVEELLKNDIHVFVDKPITSHFDSTKRLVELAERKKLILLAGFNRRYSPVYNRLKEVENPNMVIVQKNRKALPGEIRTFIFDDFIHVVDTVRYLFPHPIEKLTVTGSKRDNILSHVVVQFISSRGTALAIMNRENGTNEEKAEVMGHLKKEQPIIFQN
ncbi:Gfo/Idh/MocA family oxidoreductase [Neobacillus sp. PS3-34]|uniref:Gfo/Idh/MocA family protein n=1 Tax=Neobacillus sp. PS3-34 TaxID=3070678 RepID=UPI0027DFE94F|nr:Gfo/Idh/MocA family oxidoreductase [Neobacillus sp. PS3-34]WML46607.1 Gfo/Idh/MocA family oxidoreductase [Neobacillus sp. PS3-34]